ncbi:MAG: hypothetical protein ACJATV_000832 [Granulosicoccus sp.]|jgi:hypothetical protein
MTAFLTILLSVFILFALLLVLLKVKTPYYRIDEKKMIAVLEMVLTGQASENDWQVTFGMIIRHSPELEMIRQQCLDIEEAHYIGNQKPPYLFSEKGLARLREVLTELQAESGSKQ